MIGVAAGLLAAFLLGTGWVGYLVFAVAGLVLEQGVTGWRKRRRTLSARDGLVHHLLETALSDHPWRSDGERKDILRELVRSIDLSVSEPSLLEKQLNHEQSLRLAAFVRDLRSRFDIPTARMEEMLDSLGIHGEERYDLLPEDDRSRAYKILGLPQGADEAEVRRTFRLLASQFHPDLNSSLDPIRRRKADEAFLKIRDAVDRISRNDRA